MRDGIWVWSLGLGEVLMVRERGMGCGGGVRQAERRVWDLCDS